MKVGGERGPRLRRSSHTPGWPDASASRLRRDAVAAGDDAGEPKTMDEIEHGMTPTARRAVSEVLERG